MADRCLDIVRREPIAVEEGEAHCTVSVGVAECESGFIESETHLVRRANEALNAAKSRGGNIAVHWDELVLRETDGPALDLSGLEAMRDEFQRLQQQLKQSYLDSTRALVAAVEAKDPYTEKHSVTVAHYAMNFARHLGLAAAQVQAIGTAAILHDIGKIGIPDSILTKPGKLEPEEFELVKRHPVLGTQILEHIRFLRSELPFILHHHERWDGRGYPAGLAGEAIPLGARILHIADATDAMLSARSYKPGYDLDRVIGELRRGAGKQFDPALVEAFLQWIESSPDQIVYPKDRNRLLPGLLSMWQNDTSGRLRLLGV
jgi:putative nucleotidyltransferase with HDIG domain